MFLISFPLNFSSNSHSPCKLAQIMLILIILTIGIKVIITLTLMIRRLTSFPIRFHLLLSPLLLRLQHKVIRIRYLSQQSYLLPSHQLLQMVLMIIMLLQYTYHITHRQFPKISICTRHHTFLSVFIIIILFIPTGLQRQLHI